ncbi:MAG: ImmA/IrrE family metallo-endopeptidase [Aggregatilineales bacterium]
MSRLLKKKIRQKAIELLEETSIQHPPINVGKAAKACGALVRYEPFDGDLSGILYSENDKIIIGVNQTHSRRRKRFTIAHELGHLKLHNSNELFVDRTFPIYLRSEISSQAIDPLEIEANTFAAEFLMPVSMLDKDIHGQIIDYEDDSTIKALADKYDVSLQAMIFRLINLGYLKEQ